MHNLNACFYFTIVGPNDRTVMDWDDSLQDEEGDPRSSMIIAYTSTPASTDDVIWVQPQSGIIK